ncbi:MAG: NADH-quinone oxidoreductase subunit M [Firmicutes bacterium HGW-Firmicutes-14]|nr:MAG: NADH-quinone oxidoreductase subunit M [Firmicutes bacterium HGW-Firmicutes-14]
MSFPVLTVILLAPVIGALIAVFIPKEESKIIKAVAGVTTFISLILTIIIYIIYYTQHLAVGGFAFTEDIPWVTDLGVVYSLGVDGFSLPMLLLTNIIGFTAVFSRSWSVEKRAKEFYILLLILITGVMGTFVARDLFIFFLFYEVVVIPIYIMVIIWGSGSKTKAVTKEYAGMKLTIFLLIGSAFLLAAMIWMYMEAAGLRGAPTFDIATLASLSSQFSGWFQIVVFGMMAFGFTCLLSMFPFHSWSPDGYAGAPTAVSMIHAGVLKKIGGYGLVRVGLFILPIGAKFWAPWIAILAVANVVYAALICLAQKDMKYVVGYSSVSHMGFVLIGMASLNIIGLNGAVANMFGHGVMSALFFSMVGYIYGATKSRYIPDLGGLAHQMPIAATGFVVAAMASAGLPGLVSFVPEFTTFVGAFSVPALRIPAIVALTGVVLGAVYVLRMVANVLFGPRKEEWDHVEDIKGSYMIPVVVLIIFIVGFGVFPSLLMDMVNSGLEPIAAKLAEVTAASAGQIGGNL